MVKKINYKVFIINKLHIKPNKFKFLKKLPHNGDKSTKRKYLIISIFKKTILKNQYYSKKNKKKVRNQFKEKRIQNVFKNIFVKSKLQLKTK